MNIAMVVYSHYSRDARVRRYADALADKNINVDILCLKENYWPKESNIRLFHYPLPRKRFGRIWNVFEYFLFFSYSFMYFTLFYFIRKWEVIHVHNMPELLVFTALVPKLFGSRIILDMHDPMPELYMAKYHTSENSLMVRWLKWLEGLSFKFADQIITANDEFKSLFLKRLNPAKRGSTPLKNKISVILNCPDPKIFSNDQRPTTNDHFTLLYMGTVEERFGLDIAVEAMKELIKNIPNIRFIIIPKLEDEGEYFESLKCKVQSAKLDDDITFLEPLPLEKIAEKLREADVGIVLAKNGVFTESIFPVKLLEFIQMKIPVIATKTKALSKFFDDRSLYFLPRNTSKDFSDAVTSLYKNPSLRKSLVKNASKYLEKHNWEKEKQKYYNVIN